jgi:methanogenic corrinoid protein MtbC1
MIRWCSYCQTFLGEAPPYEDFSFTHTICGPCQAKGYIHDARRIQAMQAVGRYYQRLIRAADAGDMVRAADLVDEGLGLGHRVGDLAWGVLQPLLRRIGERWAKGELSVANEHRFSAPAVAAIELLFAKDPALKPRRQHRRPEVLLVMAEGNYHSLGLRLVELAFCLRKKRTQTLMPGLPAKEVVTLVRSLRPKILGVSVSLAPQLRSVRELHALLQQLPAKTRPALIVGGQALRQGLALPPEWGVKAYADFHADTPL